MIKRTAQLVSKDLTPSGEYLVTLSVGSSLISLRCTPEEGKQFADTVVTEPPVGPDGNPLGPDGKPVSGPWVTTYLDKLPPYALNIGPVAGYAYPPVKEVKPPVTPIPPEAKVIAPAKAESPFATPGAKPAKPTGTPHVMKL